MYKILYLGLSKNKELRRLSCNRDYWDKNIWLLSFFQKFYNQVIFTTL